MQIQIRNRLLVLLAMTTLMFSAYGHAGQSSSIKVGGAMGTWQIKVIADPGAPFTEVVNLATIDREGQMVNVDPGLGTSVGQVFRLGKKKFGIGFWGFIDQGGPLIRYEIQADARLVTGDRLEGQFRALLEDLDGNSLGGWEGVIEADRLVPSAY